MLFSPNIFLILVAATTGSSLVMAVDDASNGQDQNLRQRELEQIKIVTQGGGVEIDVETANQEPAGLEAKTNSVVSQSDLESLVSAYPELEDLNPEQQEQQISAYEDFIGGASMEEVNAKYEAGITTWFTCCLPGGTSGCRIECYDYDPHAPGCGKEVCLGNADFYCGWTGVALRECCQYPDKHGRKFWFWESCQPKE